MLSPLSTFFVLHMQFHYGLQALGAQIGRNLFLRKEFKNIECELFVFPLQTQKQFVTIQLHGPVEFSNLNLNCHPPFFDPILLAAIWDILDHFYNITSSRNWFR